MENNKRKYRRATLRTGLSEPIMPQGKKQSHPNPRKGTGWETVTCPCGKVFSAERYRKRKFCSKECFNKYWVPHNKGEGVHIKCANCGKEFWRPRKSKTQIHCSKKCRIEAHHETRICKGCGKEFKIRKSSTKKFCSFECFSKWHKKENHYKWDKGEGKRISCKYCGEIFYQPKDAPSWVYCSVECKKADCRTTIKCLECGKEFEIMKHNRSRRFCSFSCFHKWYRGDRVSQWNGGTGKEPYPFEWTKELKEQIKNRDNYTCQKCGNKEDLVVHHIDYDKKNCKEDNLVTLCNGCNSLVNFNRGFWMGFFVRALQEKFGGDL